MNTSEQVEVQRFHRPIARSILVFDSYEQVRSECEALVRSGISYRLGFKGHEQREPSVPGYEGYQLLTKPEWYYLRSDPIHLIVMDELVVPACESLQLMEVPEHLYQGHDRRRLARDLLDAGIPHLTEDPRTIERTFGLFLPARHEEAVLALLDRRTRQQKRQARLASRTLKRPWRPERSLALMTTALYAAWILAFGIYGTRTTPAFASGHLSYVDLVAGEPWRCVTSLSLHLGQKHLAGNLVFGSALLALASTRLGGGLAAFSMVAVGFLANLCNALLHGPGYRSVGASTAVFVLVGVVSASDAARRQGEQRRWSWRLSPMVLALLSLPFFGAGPDENTDVGAHTCGLVLGCVAGWTLGSWKSVTRYLTPHWQVGLLIATGALSILCWTLALLAHRG